MSVAGLSLEMATRRICGVWGGGRFSLGRLNGCVLAVGEGVGGEERGEGRATYILAGGIGGVNSGLDVGEVFEELFCSMGVDSHGFVVVVVVVVGHGLVDGGVDEVKVCI